MIIKNLLHARIAQTVYSTLASVPPVKFLSRANHKQILDTKPLDGYTIFTFCSLNVLLLFIIHFKGKSLEDFVKV